MGGTMAGIAHGGYGVGIQKIDNGFMVSVCFEDPDYKGAEELVAEIKIPKLPEIAPAEADTKEIALRLYNHFRAQSESLRGAELSMVGGQRRRKTVNLYAPTLEDVNRILEEYVDKIPVATEDLY